jgi:hypothetical protein
VLYFVAKGQNLVETVTESSTDLQQKFIPEFSINSGHIENNIRKLLSILDQMAFNHWVVRINDDLQVGLQSLFRFCNINVSLSASDLLLTSGPIAQSVEQMAFNHWVEGSSPSRITIIFKKKGQPFWLPFSLF